MCAVCAYPPEGTEQDFDQAERAYYLRWIADLPPESRLALWAWAVYETLTAEEKLAHGEPPLPPPTFDGLDMH